MPAVPKPSHKRRTKTRKERGKITPRVAEEVLERAGGVCERCGLPPVYGSYRDRLELAHLEQKSQGGRGDIPWNVAALCGPSVNSGTCHWLIDSRRKENWEWVENKIAELEQLYDKNEWSDEE